jgi:hypothetical protein
MNNVKVYFTATRTKTLKKNLLERERERETSTTHPILYRIENERLRHLIDPKDTYYITRHRSLRLGLLGPPALPCCVSLLYRRISRTRL